MNTSLQQSRGGVNAIGVILWQPLKLTYFIEVTDVG